MTNLEMAAAFNEWMRRFIEEPERFEVEFRQVNAFLADEKAGQEPSYGHGATEYLTKCHAELTGRNPA